MQCLWYCSKCQVVLKRSSRIGSIQRSKCKSRVKWAREKKKARKELCARSAEQRETGGRPWRALLKYSIQEEPVELLKPMVERVEGLLQPPGTTERQILLDSRCLPPHDQVKPISLLRSETSGRWPTTIGTNLDITQVGQ